MERQTATTGVEAQVNLPQAVQHALGAAPGTRVELMVDEADNVRLLAASKERLPAEEALDLMDELQGMFKGQPSLEDEYFRTRDRDKW